MEKEPVITHLRVLDYITLEDEYSYSVYITLGLHEFGDYYVQILFNELDSNSIAEVAKLYQLNKALKFTSQLVTKEKYNITHIVTERISTHGFEVTWECLSDDPNISLII